MSEDVRSTGRERKREERKRETTEERSLWADRKRSVPPSLGIVVDQIRNPEIGCVWNETFPRFT